MDSSLGIGAIHELDNHVDVEPSNAGLAARRAQDRFSLQPEIMDELRGFERAGEPDELGLIVRPNVHAFERGEAG
jgi:hypothetical protein